MHSTFAASANCKSETAAVLPLLLKTLDASASLRTKTKKSQRKHRHRVDTSQTEFIYACVSTIWRTRR